MCCLETTTAAVVDCASWQTFCPSLCSSVASHSPAFLVFVVEKSSRVADFVLTVYFLHLIFTWIYSSCFPPLYWFITSAVVATVTCLLGQYCCQIHENKELSGFANILDTSTAENKRLKAADEDL